MDNIYEEIIDSIEEGVVFFDGSNRVAVFNQVSETLTGISKKRALGSDSTELFSANRSVVDLIEKTGREGQGFSMHDGHIVRQDGSTVSVSLATSPILSADGGLKGVALLMRDMSRIRALEEDVRRSDGLASVGILVAGLAHEIKNPLGGIKGAAQLLKEVDDDDELEQCTDIIIKETDRVSGLLEELLDFSNPKRMTFAPLNIHQVLDGVITLLSKSEEGEGIEFSTDYDPSIPPLPGDSEKLTQVFINLVKNGCEAMKKKGRLKIKTRIINDYLLHGEAGTRATVMAVDIKDEGPGIDEGDLPRLFTPFFSKKQGGTGLGLSLSDRIIREHKGGIRVSGSPGEGAVFTVCLPLR